MFLPRITGWTTYERMFTRSAIWRPAVRDVLRRHGIALRRIQGTFPGTSAVFRSETDRGDLLAKFFPPMIAGDARREAAALGALADVRGLAVPRLVASGILRDRTVWRYLILRPLPGRPIREVKRRMSRADHLASMRAVGRRLRAIHAVPVPAGVPPLNLRRLILNALREYRNADVFPPALIQDLRRRLPRLTRSTGRPRLLHADLYEDHLIMNRINGRWRATGVIDLADAAAGDPMYEWMPVRLGFRWSDPKFFLAAVRARHPGLRLTARWRDRSAAYMLIHRFGPRALLDQLKKESVSTNTMTWTGLRDWLVPPT